MSVLGEPRVGQVWQDRDWRSSQRFYRIESFSEGAITHPNPSFCRGYAHMVLVRGQFARKRTRVHLARLGKHWRLIEEAPTEAIA